MNILASLNDVGSLAIEIKRKFSDIFDNRIIVVFQTGILFSATPSRRLESSSSITFVLFATDDVFYQKLFRMNAFWYPRVYVYTDCARESAGYQGKSRHLRKLNYLRKSCTLRTCFSPIV